VQSKGTSLHRRAHKQKGFTLIEAAIVLVIVGFLLAAVLQGRQMIESARYKSLQRDLGEYREAFESFRERYNALPGDYSQAVSRLGLPAGDGNGVIDDGPGCANAADETCRAWQHLRAARLIKGDATVDGADASPEHAFNGTVSAFFTGTEGNSEFGHKLLIEDVPAEFAAQLDEDLDDGVFDSGFVSCRAGSGCSGSWPADNETRVDVVYAF